MVNGGTVKSSRCFGSGELGVFAVFGAKNGTTVESGLLLLLLLVGRMANYSDT